MLRDSYLAPSARESCVLPIGLGSLMPAGCMHIYLTVVGAVSIKTPETVRCCSHPSTCRAYTYRTLHGVDGGGLVCINSSQVPPARECCVLPNGLVRLMPAECIQIYIYRRGCSPNTNLRGRAVVFASLDMSGLCLSNSAWGRRAWILLPSALVRREYVHIHIYPSGCSVYMYSGDRVPHLASLHTHAFRGLHIRIHKSNKCCFLLSSLKTTCFH